MNIKRYVVGFMFDPEKRLVALIYKNRPEWQKGKLNGIGGKIEPGEISIDAMIREFWEETGVATIREDWIPFARITSPTSDPTGEAVEIFFYKSFSEKLTKTRTTTDEKVHLFSVYDLIHHGYSYNVIDNLRWLLPFAVSDYERYADVVYK